MKNFLLLAALSLISLGAKSADVDVFQHSFDSETSLDGWTVLDLNDDQSTWAFNSNDKAVRYTYNSNNDGNDWLISPAINIAETGYYKLSFVYSGSNYGERMSVHYGKSADAASMTNTIIDLGTFFDETDVTGESLIYVSNPGEIRIGFYAYSEKGKFKIVLKNVDLKKANGVDAGIKEITSPVTGENLGEEPVTISLINNGKEPISNFEIGYSVNGEKTVKETYTGTVNSGTSATHTFTTKVDLSQPRGIYNIKTWVKLEGDEVTANDSAEIKVKNITEAGIPYYTSFEDPEENENIKFFNLNNDDSSWGVEKNGGWSMFSRTGDYCILYNYNKENDADDWAILEGIQMEPGYYSLKFWYATMGDHNEKLAVYYGKEQNFEAMTTKIVEYSPFMTENYIESASVIHIEEAGKYYFGFYAFSDKNNNVIVIDDISIERISGEQVDLAILQAVSPMYGYVREQTSQDLEFLVSNLGIKDAEKVQIKASVDGKQVLEETVNVKAQETISKTVKDALKLAPGKYVLKIEIFAEDDSDLENNVLETEFTVVGKPAKIWDFEEGKLPEDMTFINYDGIQTHQNIRDFISNPDGWGLVEIQATEDSPYGNYMLGMVSFLEDRSRADKWCILPRFKVPEEGGHLVWTANSVEAEFPEYYEVYASNDEIDPENFQPGMLFKKMTVTQENPATVPATRGIDLVDYAGKEINLAFRLNTRDGYALTLDNIGLYGNGVSSIDKVSEENNILSIITEGETLHVISTSAVKSVTVYDSLGNLVKKANNTNEVNVAGIGNGLYIVVVDTENGRIGQKWVK